MSAAEAVVPRSTTPSAGEGMLDLNALWRAVAVHKYWIIVPTLLALVASFVAVNIVTPRYTGEARLILENRDGFFTRPTGDRDGGGERFDTEAVLSQVQVIMSRDIAREAIKRLKLVGNSEFDSGAGLFGSLQQLMVRFGLSRNPADRTPEDRVLEKYYDNLLVFPVARSRVIAIEFQSRDAELAARAANTIAAVYLESLESAKKDSARGASQWLGGAITPLRQRVQEAEAKVEEFRARAGLLVGANNTTITQQQLADLSLQLSNARTIQADSQAKARLLREAIRNGRTFEVPDVANNELVRRLIEQRVNLRAQIALESRTLLPEHPRIKELTAQITDLEGQIRAAAERTVRTLENEARIAGSRVETLSQTIDAQKQSVSLANESEVQLRALEREAKSQRDQLEQFLSRQREAIARDADNASPADARVVSRAITPLTPSFPKKVPTVAVVTLATFFVALASVISRELLSGRSVMAAAPMPAAPMPAQSAPQSAPAAPPQGAARFSNFQPELPGDTPEHAMHVAADGLDAAEAPQPGVPHQPDRAARAARVAGLIGHDGRVRHLQLPTQDAGSWSRHIRAFAPGASGGSALLVMDAGTRAGAARILASELSEDMPVVLVDLTGRDRAQASGLSELLAGDAGFADIIDRDPDSNLHVIGAGRAGRDAVIAANDLFGLAITALTDAYDLVLIEASSRDMHRFGEALMGHADGAIVLADQVSNGHAVETAYKLCEGTERPVAIAVFEDGSRVGAMPTVPQPVTV